ncbi:MAG: chemotaxis protein CheX [Gammaproteobacteria bacterium]|nr:chemotaxis protein CheX [Gammaproteobacteria bacterium]
MIDRSHIEVFVDSLTRYFTHLNQSTGSHSDDLEISAPYLLSSKELVGFDYTGIINVSGRHSGKVFITARSSMLKRILLLLGEQELNEELRRDLIGEVANTLAGNARRHLGADFHISTPKVIEGVIETTRFKLSPRCFVLPFRWKSNVAELIISVES